MGTLPNISGKAAKSQLLISEHAFREMGEEFITVDELAEALSAPTLIEDYPDDTRGASCLVLGWTKSRQPLHLVVGWLSQPTLKIITVYRPDLAPNKWEANWRKRR